MFIPNLMFIPWLSMFNGVYKRTLFGAPFLENSVVGCWYQAKEKKLQILKAQAR